MLAIVMLVGVVVVVMVVVVVVLLVLLVLLVLGVKKKSWAAAKSGTKSFETVGDKLGDLEEQQAARRLPAVAWPKQGVLLRDHVPFHEEAPLSW